MYSKFPVRIPDILEYHTTHQSEDIVHEGLSKEAQYLWYVLEVYGTFNNFPFGRFLEELALGNDCFGLWSFENFYFDHDRREPATYVSYQIHVCILQWSPLSAATHQSVYSIIIAAHLLAIHLLTLRCVRS